MDISKAHPFVRYAHYIPITPNSSYILSIPYDHRIFYMYDGSARIQTDDKIYDLNKYDMLIIPAGSRYRLLPTDRHNAVYIALNFDITQTNINQKAPIPPTAADKFNLGLMSENPQNLVSSLLDKITYIPGAKDFSSRLNRIEREYAQKLLYYEDVISNILAEILLECLRINENQNFKGNKDITKTVIGYINENYSRPISNQSIGNALKLHPNYISKLVKAATGFPLHQYIIKVRISHSMELLSEKKYAVSEIAELCGFCDIYHFSRIFKKIVGVSPSKYL